MQNCKHVFVDIFVMLQISRKLQTVRFTIPSSSINYIYLRFATHEVNSNFFPVLSSTSSSCSTFEDL
ncbi:hypothetical protein GQX74_010769 [Glossina fuscipes]|nr:hypothetical protein GQX74_010769 [Glossina fuscipes]